MITFVKKAFNKAAPQYDASCQLQLQTGEMLIDLLKNYSVKSHAILDAGCGTGIVTKKLASSFQYQTFYAIDIADQLLLHAKEKLSDLNIHVELADYNDIDMFFDVIYANLSLHWSHNIETTLISLYKKLNLSGILAFSIPLEGTFQEIQDFCSISKFHELSFIEKYADFNIVHAQSQKITFEFDNLLKALKSIKSVGTNYVAHRNLSLSKLRKQLQHSNSFKLSYHIGYFIIKKL